MAYILDIGGLFFYNILHKNKLVFRFLEKLLKIIYFTREYLMEIEPTTVSLTVERLYLFATVVLVIFFIIFYNYDITKKYTFVLTVDGNFVYENYVFFLILVDTS